MRRFVDLHTHSTASDGSSAPGQLVCLAEAKRLAAVALTDHDTTDGLAEARAAAESFPALRFIPGIEVSAEFPTGVLHILALGIDDSSAPLREMVQRLQAARQQRNPKIIAKLQAMGMDISMADVLAVAGRRSGGGIVSRVHVAETLRRKKYVRTAGEAFEKLIGSGAPAFVDKERLSPREAIAAIRQAGGVAALAHPPQLRYTNRAQLERIVRSCMHAGLNGIEVYHTDHSAQQTRLYLDLARRYGLCAVGGSDFHGAAKPEARLGRPRVPVAAITGELAARFFGDL